MNKLVLIGFVIWVAAVLMGSMIPPEQVEQASIVRMIRSVGLVVVIIGIAQLFLQKKQ